ncbi:MAG: hypothetical protein P8Y71_05960 [Pseudolabrys sp.]
MSGDVLDRFSKWHRDFRIDREPAIEGIEGASPQTVNVATKIVTTERSYLETYRHIYYEVLLPAHRRIKEIYHGIRRHPDFVGCPLECELDRFLSWIKLTFTTDEKLEENPIRRHDDLTENVRLYVRKWLESRQNTDDDRVARIEKLKQIFADETVLLSTSFANLTDALLGCAAFDEQLRFTKGGQEALIPTVLFSDSPGIPAWRD